MEYGDKAYNDFEQAVKTAVDEHGSRYEWITEDAAEAADRATQAMFDHEPAPMILAVADSGEATVNVGFSGVSPATDGINRTVPLLSAFMIGDFNAAEVEELIVAVEKTCAIARNRIAGRLLPESGN